MAYGITSIKSVCLLADSKQKFRGRYPVKPAFDHNVHVCHVGLYALCLTKVNHLVYDNNFGKCGPIFKILSIIDS